MRIGILIIFCVACTASAFGGEAAYRPGEILVKFRDSTAAMAVTRVLAARPGAVRVTDRVQRVPLRSGETVDQAMLEMTALPEVEYAQPNYISRVQLLPNDPRFREQWALNNTGQSIGGLSDPDHDVRAAAAWDLTTGSADVVVALIDTGVDLGNPDLSVNLWRGPNGIPGRDFVGFCGSVSGVPPQDDEGHGTSIAGALAARGGNGIGIAGVAWEMSLMVLRAFDNEGRGDSCAISEAIDYAVANGARVINASFGKNQFDQVEYDAINRARQAGVLVVAAACNDSGNNDVTSGQQVPCYPASYDLDNVISVAATDNTDALIPESNYGQRSVDLGAPGAAILTFRHPYSGSLPLVSGDYLVVKGTSISAAFVSGAAALLLARNPTLRSANLRAAILNNVDPVDNLRGFVATGGRLNIAAALTSTEATTQLAPSGSQGGGGGGSIGLFEIMAVVVGARAAKRSRLSPCHAREGGHPGP